MPATTAHSHVVRLDYGQFSLISVADPESYDPDSYMPVLNRALEGDGIAHDGTNLVVLSPHQMNSEMRLDVELWPERPPDDTSAWQEAFEAGVTVHPSGLSFESPTSQSQDLDVPAGSYAVRITGRGFVARGWPASTTPGDAWRVQLWPADGPLQARRLASWDGRA